MAGETHYEIRVLGPDDVGLMRELLDCFGEAFEDATTYGAAQPDDAYLARLLAGEGFYAIVAVSEGRVIGGLAGYELAKFEQARSEFYIYDLGVRERYRRQGVATALIEETKRLARSRGAWVVFVQADSDDPPAIALYSGLGTREDVVHFDFTIDGAG
jgi:ribosomal protein S18 acetylase RimI-like enzyme